MLNQWLLRQVKSILGHYQHALTWGIVLALTPYTVWLSMSLVALVTLRKGWREGAYLLAPIFVVSYAINWMSSSAPNALSEAILTFIPIYVAALTLRYSVSWQMVAYGLLLEMLFSAMFAQIFVPDVIMVQFEFMKTVLNQLSPDNALVTLLSNGESRHQLLMANYLFGVQMVSVGISTTMSLLCARSMQSQLFFPQGFRAEINAFRGNKIMLCVFVLLVCAASAKNVLAMNMLPAMVAYFMLAGMSLGQLLFAQKKSIHASMMLILAVIFLPFIMLPITVLIGLFDSILNFRCYLTGAKADKTT